MVDGTLSWRSLPSSQGEIIVPILMASTAYDGEQVDYKKILHQEIFFDQDAVFLPWEEMMFLVAQVGISALPILGKLEPQARLFLVQNTTFCYQLVAKVAIESAFARLLLGTHTLDVSLAVRLHFTQAGGVEVEQVELGSPQVKSQRIWDIVCRRFTGEENCLALARKYLECLPHVGRVGILDRPVEEAVTAAGIHLILNKK